MKKLIHGIVEFRKSLTEENRSLFAKLALGQRPDALFIACSDSRVVPNLFASTNPGDLFVLRNLGNLVPPPSSESSDTSVQAALEFSVLNLNISNIIVCGHSECAVMQMLADRSSSCCSHVHSWIKHGVQAVDKIDGGFSLNPKLSKHNQVSQMNVLQQMEHIASYDFIRQKMEKRELRIHGWWFDIAQADVYCFEPSFNQFVLIDEKEAELILGRLS